MKLTDFDPLLILTILGLFGFLIARKLDENDGMRDFIERDANNNLKTPLLPTSMTNIDIPMVEIVKR